VPITSTSHFRVLVIGAPATQIFQPRITMNAAPMKGRIVLPAQKYQHCGK
jgi:hypothetical protein